MHADGVPLDMEQVVETWSALISLPWSCAQRTGGDDRQAIVVVGVFIVIGAMGVPAQRQVITGGHDPAEYGRFEAIYEFRLPQPVEIMVPYGDFEHVVMVRLFFPEALLGLVESLFMDDALETQVVDTVTAVERHEADAEFRKAPGVELVLAGNGIFPSIHTLVKTAEGLQPFGVLLFVRPEVERILFVRQSGVDAGWLTPP